MVITMKTLIVYTSKYGCTADCAKHLKDKLSCEVTLTDIGKSSKELRLDDYDSVIIGGSIYAGRVSKKLRMFCKDNLEALSNKKLGIFLCCASVDESDNYLSSNFPSELISTAKVTKAFGGEIRPDGMSLFDKLIVKAIKKATKGDFGNFKVLSEQIEEFAKEMA